VLVVEGGEGYGAARTSQQSVLIGGLSLAFVLGLLAAVLSAMGTNL